MNVKVTGDDQFMGCSCSGGEKGTEVIEEEREWFITGLTQSIQSLVLRHLSQFTPPDPTRRDVVSEIVNRISDDSRLPTTEIWKMDTFRIFEDGQYHTFHRHDVSWAGHGLTKIPITWPTVSNSASCLECSRFPQTVADCRWLNSHGDTTKSLKIDDFTSLNCIWHWHPRPDWGEPIWILLTVFLSKELEIFCYQTVFSDSWSIKS